MTQVNVRMQYFTITSVEILYTSHFLVVREILLSITIHAIIIGTQTHISKSINTNELIVFEQTISCSVINKNILHKTNHFK